MAEEYPDQTQAEQHRRWLYSTDSGVEVRFFPDHNEVQDIAAACSVLGLKKVLTSGTYDILHEGHAKYLDAAKKLGDVLFVGVDSNERTRQRKGDDRPVVDEMERVSILSHLRPVDLITLKYADDEKMKLLKIVQPDVYVMSESTYETEEAQQAMQRRIEEAEEYCNRVALMKPMATSGTTARIRSLQLDGGKRLADKIYRVIQDELHDGSS